MKFIGIIGSRRRNHWTDFEKVELALDKVYQKGDYLVSGGCPKGGDSFAEEIAKDRGLPILVYYPNWKGHHKAAGFLRNTLIAEKADILLAVVSEDRTGGTEDTIRKAEKLGKKIILIPPTK